LAVWDYCLASASLFFDISPVDPTAQRISEALDATPEGLTRTQIRTLFRRHVSKERIDLALEQLSSLGLINRRTAAGRGRSSTFWFPETKTPDAGA
jgi:predicted transcriptional regulator